MEINQDKNEIKNVIKMWSKGQFFLSRFLMPEITSKKSIYPYIYKIPEGVYNNFGDVNGKR